MRARSNRRTKTRERRWSAPRIRIRWRALLVPPLALAAAGIAIVSAKELLDRPVGKLRIEGELERVTALEIEAVLAPYFDRGVLSLNLDELSQRVEALDWVDAAHIGRRWPDTLVVDIVEHQAAARWGTGGLLNVRGELFAEDTPYLFPELPKLNGPDGSEQQVAAYYLALRGPLIEAHLALDTLRMDERGSLSFTLASGQEIRIGRQDIRKRIDRFFSIVAPVLAKEFRRIDYVDLRYTNGFAVGWSEPADRELLSNRELASNG